MLARALAACNGGSQWLGMPCVAWLAKAKMDAGHVLGPRQEPLGAWRPLTIADPAEGGMANDLGDFLIQPIRDGWLCLVTRSQRAPEASEPDLKIYLKPAGQGDVQCVIQTQEGFPQDPRPIPLATFLRLLHALSKMNREGVIAKAFEHLGDMASTYQASPVGDQEAGTASSEEGWEMTFGIRIPGDPAADSLAVWFELQVYGPDPRKQSPMVRICAETNDEIWSGGREQLEALAEQADNISTIAQRLFGG